MYKYIIPLTFTCFIGYYSSKIFVDQINLQLSNQFENQRKYIKKAFQDFDEEINKKD